jgi:hypothetical protein
VPLSIQQIIAALSAAESMEPFGIIPLSTAVLICCAASLATVYSVKEEELIPSWQPDELQLETKTGFTLFK